MAFVERSIKTLVGDARANDTLCASCVPALVAGVLSVAAVGFTSGEAWASEPLPLFDAHVHYNEKSRARFSPEAIISKLDQAGVRCALVSSTPNENTLALKRRVPQRIRAFARPYRTYEDKSSWFERPGLLTELGLWASRPDFEGIGEFHLFGPQLNAGVLGTLIRNAEQNALPLQAHGDSKMIEALFARSGEIAVIWAHAGTKPTPAFLAKMVERYPSLYVDLSLRNRLIAPGGQLDDGWRRLFNSHPDRFMAAIDTYSPNQWDQYEEIANETRHWLRQLPPDVAKAIAYANATRLLGCSALVS